MKNLISLLLTIFCITTQTIQLHSIDCPIDISTSYILDNTETREKPDFMQLNKNTRTGFERGVTNLYQTNTKLEVNELIVDRSMTSNKPKNQVARYTTKTYKLSDSFISNSINYID